jgi:formate dehydrogenase maturation protein FdhE
MISESGRMTQSAGTITSSLKNHSSFQDVQSMNKATVEGQPPEGSSSVMTCPLCSIANLVTITMKMNERELTLHSCSRCETKWWKADGSNVGLSSVLDAAARRSA